jgi:hypothetical protein
MDSLAECLVAEDLCVCPHCAAWFRGKNAEKSLERHLEKYCSRNPDRVTS